MDIEEKKEEVLKSVISNLPKEPGVYRFYNQAQQIIYIGKAKDLKNRVSSYFVNGKNLNRKTRRLVSEIANIAFTVVTSESDAFLLENNLIKEHQPKYNILLKDDKTYPFICVTNERFPRVFSIRNPTEKGHTYFGPYTSVKFMNVILNLIRKLYKIRTCSYALTQENVAAGKFKVCLEYHIKNCLGPCEGLQPEEEYNEEILQIKSILKGKLGPVKTYFKDKMQDAAEKLEFEKAQFFKSRYELIDNFQNKSVVVNPKIDEVEAYTILSDEQNAYVNFMKVTHGAVTQTDSFHLKKKLDEADEEILSFMITNLRSQFSEPAAKIITPIPVPLELPGVEIVQPKIGDLKKLLALSYKNIMYYKREKERGKLELQDKKRSNSAVLQLKADLNLTEMPNHIECFDNSNIQGTNPVAAMVCFKDGKPAKSEYRRFNIKTVVGPDDFTSMFEVVHRRYSRLLEESKPLPNLVVIDGGKGQLNAALRALKTLGIEEKIPIVGIAKRLEEIYYPGDQDPLHINKKSRSLTLLQKVRNEAHRFAITFHRDKRSKASLKSALSDIPGIGPSYAQKLLAHFQAVSKIKEASEEDLAKVVGKVKAKAVYQFFNEQTSA